MLQRHVDQFVIHYDAAGTSRSCFRVLHDVRCLSVHFMIDLDGTIYQTLDVKERAWHASASNDRSVGVEVANIGAYPPADAAKVLPQWYTSDDHGTRVTLPARMGDGGIRTPNFVAHPARPGIISGELHSHPYEQYDFTPQQYESLACLGATLHAVLPKIALTCPTETDGSPLRRALTEVEWTAYAGFLGHCHVTANKVDPGPAFDWEKLLLRARAVAPADRNTHSGPITAEFVQKHAR